MKVCAYFPTRSRSGQRARVRQARGHRGGDRVHRVGQRVRHRRGPGRVAAALRHPGAGHYRGVPRALVGAVAATVDRHRPGRRLLVGHLHAPGRGLAHHRVRRAAPRPRVLRGAVRRQPRYRPPGTDADRLRAPGPRAPRAGTGPGCCRWGTTSPSTPTSAIPGSSPTSNAGGRSASRPSSTTPPISEWHGGSSTCPKSLSKPVTSTVAWSMLSVSARAASLRAQPLSGSRDQPSEDGRRAPALRFGDPGSWPWSARCAPACTSSAGFTNQSLRAR